jgi:hypothetical protein
VDLAEFFSPDAQAPGGRIANRLASGNSALRRLRVLMLRFLANAWKSRDGTMDWVPQVAGTPETCAQWKPTDGPAQATVGRIANRLASGNSAHRRLRVRLIVN